MSLIKIVKKILKLIKHEKSARDIGNVHEADRFAEQITYLKTKYKITQELIDEQQPNQRNSELVFNVGSKYFRRRRIRWQEMIFHSVARHYGCRCGGVKNSNLKFVEGEKDQRKKVIKTYLHLHEQGEIQVGKYLRWLEETGDTGGNKARQNFLIGFADTVCLRIRSIKEIEKAILELQSLIAAEPEYPATEHLINEVKKEIKSLPEAQTHIPANHCTALVKSERIVVSTAPVNHQKQEKFKPLPDLETENIDVDYFTAGIRAGSQIEFDRELVDYICTRIERLNELKRIRQKIEAENRKANWEEEFLSRGHLRYGFSTGASKTYTQQSFNFYIVDEFEGNEK